MRINVPLFWKCVVLVLNKWNNSSWYCTHVIKPYYMCYIFIITLLHSTFSQLKVPPFKFKRFSAHVGAAVHFSQELVVGCKVINEAAVQAERLKQRARLSLQGTFTIHLWPKRLGNAKVLPEYYHIHLQEKQVMFTSSYSKYKTSSCLLISLQTPLFKMCQN